jgi:hypothetical protein
MNEQGGNERESKTLFRKHSERGVYKAGFLIRM